LLKILDDFKLIEYMKEQQLNYTYTIDPDSDTTGAKILKFVGKHKKVLEIGAGPGSVTKVLQDINQCNVTALEVNPDYIARLTEFCPTVISADLNDPQWNQKFTEEQKFDIVLAADVLEHLYEPLACLKNMATLLNESGSIILSLPHVGHAVIAGCLWDGDFEYGQWGLLDRTHIRFFGIKNIQNLVEDADLKVTDVSFVVRSPDRTEFAQRWSRLPQSFKKEILANPFACVYQVVLQAVPKSSPGKSITIAEAAIPSAQIFPFGILNQTYGLTGFFRNIARIILSKEQKEKLQSYLKKQKINV
jgi:2-polyprenyl-3-methyl-5-hydroxy-6-metoxy-1,4-benzoquinol methylase